MRLLRWLRARWCLRRYRVRYVTNDGAWERLDWFDPSGITGDDGTRSDVIPIFEPRLPVLRDRRGVESR